MAAGYSILSNAAVRNLASLVLKENVVQKIMVIPNKSADMKYITDFRARTVTVARPKTAGKARRIGESTNGGFFDSSTGSAENDVYDINLDLVFTTPIKIAKVQDDMSGGIALKGQLEQLPKDIGKAVNCSYFAKLIAGNLNKGIVATSATSVVSYSFSSDYVSAMTAATSAAALAALESAIENLGNGDTDNGFDAFPVENSILYVTPAYAKYLRGLSTTFVSNYIAQQMVAAGTFNAFDTEYKLDTFTGYMGEQLGLITYNTYSLFKATAGYLGKETLADGSKAGTASTALDHLMAIAVCGLAVGGGINIGNIEVVDARGGQGWEIQPDARWGFDLFSAKGVQLIVDNTGLTATDFVTYTGSGSTATQTVKPVILMPGNRS